MVSLLALVPQFTRFDMNCATAFGFQLSAFVDLAESREPMADSRPAAIEGTLGMDERGKEYGLVD